MFVPKSNARQGAYMVDAAASCNLQNHFQNMLIDFYFWPDWSTAKRKLGVCDEFLNLPFVFFLPQKKESSSEHLANDEVLNQWISVGFVEPFRIVNKRIEPAWQQ